MVAGLLGYVPLVGSSVQSPGLERPLSRLRTQLHPLEDVRTGIQIALDGQLHNRDELRHRLGMQLGATTLEVLAAA